MMPQELCETRLTISQKELLGTFIFWKAQIHRCELVSCQRPPMLSQVSGRQLCGLQKQWLLNTVTKFGTIRLKRFPPVVLLNSTDDEFVLAALDFGRVHQATSELHTNWAASLSYPEQLGCETIETLKGTSYEATVSLMKTWTHIISCYTRISSE